MNTKSKLFLSLLLAVSLCLSVCSVPAFAETDEAGTKDFSISKDPYHTHQYVPAVTEPTCTEEGFMTYTCSCGDSYVDDYTEPLNHPEVIDVPEVPAASGSAGTTAGKKCGICGEILEGCEEIPALVQENPDLAEESSDPSKGDPVSGEDNSDPAKDNSDCVTEKGTSEEENPNPAEKNPDHEEENIDSSEESSGSAKENPASEGENSDPAEDNQDPAKENPDITEEIPDNAGEIREFDSSVITGFEISDPEDISEEVKPILDELKKRFPTEITIFLGGFLIYNADDTDRTDNKENPDKPENEDNQQKVISTEPEGAEKKTVPVSWRCLQDYDESLPVFEFVPELEDYTLAPGIELPVQRVYVESEADGPVGGHIPSGTDGDVPFSVSNRKSAPSESFNAYESGWLPPVRNQGSEGACWSFAAIGSVEADLIRGGWDRNSIDLSELYLAYYAVHKYPDPKGCNTGDRIQYTGSVRYLSNGGNNYMSYRTMANMVGPVSESTAPYPNGSPNGPSVAQMVGAYLYNPADRDGIKAAILAHGGVDAAIYWTGSCYSSTYNSYYYPYRNANHEVMLVGWDDSFPASNFRSGCQPGEGKDGAWLVRNSWGYQGYGLSGYFWLSYYDNGLLSDAVTAYDAEAPRYDYCYAYDSVPYPDAVRYLSRGQEVSQSFTLGCAEAVRAAGFETRGSNVTATVKVSNGQIVSTAQVPVGNAGFYIAELGTPLYCEAGQRITVTISFDRDSSIVFEDEGTDICGDTYYASNSGGGGFTVDGWTYPYDARIKLFTDNDSSGGQIPIEEISLSSPSLDLLAGDHEQLYVTLSPENAYGALTWKSTDTAVAKVDQGLVMAASPGNADIIVSSSNGVSAICHVTVSAIRVRGINIQGFTRNPKTSVIADSGDNSWVDIPNPIPLCLTYRTNPLNATNQDARWTSSNPSVATVTTVAEGSTGRKEARVYLKDAGTAVITVTSADGGFADTLTLNITKTMCTITYDANGGSGAPASQRYSKGAVITLRTGRPARTGYTFKGWSTSRNAPEAQYQPGAGYTVVGNVTLYAVWEINQKPTPKPMCVLSFDANGGASAPASMSVTVSEAAALPSGRPIRGGYTFKGWALSSNATTPQYQPGASYTPAGNTAFYAVWEYASSIEGYVRRCYGIILGREGDQGGVDHWTSLLSSGKNEGASIVSSFVNSTEYRNRSLNNDQAVTILYRAMLGREPDSAGKSHWKEILDAGASMNYIVSRFAGSAEFGGICSSYGIRPGTVALTENRDKNLGITKFVSRLYTKCLGRGYDTKGLNNWCGRILADKRRENVINVAMNGFFHSKEFKNKNLGNGEYIKALYRTFLGREADQSGYSHWKSLLDSGKLSRDDMIKKFAYSKEFSGIMAQYGL